MKPKKRTLRLICTEYWPPYKCWVETYVWDDHPSGTRHVVSRYGDGYCGPSDLPIVDGKPEFRTGIPRAWSDQKIIDWLSRPELKSATGFATGIDTTEPN
jgi:hypothetical protein